MDRSVVKRAVTHGKIPDFGKIADRGTVVRGKAPNGRRGRAWERSEDINNPGGVKVAYETRSNLSLSLNRDQPRDGNRRCSSLVVLNIQKKSATRCKSGSQPPSVPTPFPRLDALLPRGYRRLRESTDVAFSRGFSHRCRTRPMRFGIGERQAEVTKWISMSRKNCEV